MKLVLFPSLLVASCLVAGLYGALHDQISYTVSPEYFHDLKFKQFDIPPELHGRVGAALVGWFATWWMGLLIGVPVLIVGLIMPDWKTYLSRCLLAMAVVVATALIVGLAALLRSSFIDYGSSLTAKEVAFARVGDLHEFSYLGGFIGIITGSLFLVLERIRLMRRSNQV